MDTTRNTGTLTLQIVGNPASGGELPILMTGVFIRIRAHSGEEGAPTGPGRAQRYVRARWSGHLP